jgi:hypothetical protein
MCKPLPRLAARRRHRAPLPDQPPISTIRRTGRLDALSIPVSNSAATAVVAHPVQDVGQ